MDLKRKHNISTVASTAGNEDGLKSAPSAVLALDLPVDARSFPLVLLRVLAMVFILNWARAIFIPLMLGNGF